MTGWGSALRSEAGYEVRIEIRGVNHRNLVWKGGLPPHLQALEGEIDAAIRRFIQRGSLSLSVSCAALESRPHVRFDARLARAYMTELEQLARALGLRDGPTLDVILGLPGVLSSQEEATADELRPLLLGVLGEALAEFVASREREGRAVVADIAERSRELRRLVEVIEARWPDVVSEYRARLEERVRDFLAERGHTIEDVDLLREVTIYADRSDVAEEVARLRTHLDELDRLMADGGVVGRALDFLTQEMLREANTIGSKSSDADLAHRVVELKTALDRIKEQAQNLE